MARYRTLGLPSVALPSGRLRYDRDTVMAWLEGDLRDACEALEEDDLLDEDGDCLECGDETCAGCTDTETCGDEKCESCVEAEDDEAEDEGDEVCSVCSDEDCPGCDGSDEEE